MPNPYCARYDTNCQNCGRKVWAGDEMYACDGLFLCASCAKEGGYVCDCGAFKKAEYKTCFECRLYQDEKEDSNKGDFGMS